METSFRLNAKNLFLTYPQIGNEITKQNMLDHIESKFVMNVNQYIVAEEEHLDGNKHFHVYINVISKVNVKSQTYLDYNGKHGNYQTVKNINHCISYCTKTSNYITNIPEEDIKKIQAGYKSKEIKNQNILEKALKYGPSKLLEDGDVDIKSFEFVVRGLNSYKKLKHVDERGDIDSELPNTWNLRLSFDLDNKQCHFWIYSKEPNKGKTTFLLNLKKLYRAEFWNYECNFQDQIKKTTCIIMFDELRGKLIKVSDLNRICDGTYLYNHKGMAPVSLDIGKPLVVVCSNMAIKECYNESLTDLLYARFQEIKLN